MARAVVAGRFRGRLRRLRGVVAVMAVVALIVSTAVVVVGAAAVHAPAAGATTTPTATPTGVLGSLAEVAGTDSTGQPVTVVSMTGSLLEIGPVGESTAAFSPLNNQTMYFSVEDESGDWWPLCSAVTNAEGIAACSAEAPHDFVGTNPDGTGGTKTYIPLGAWGAVYQGASETGYFDYAASYDYGTIPGASTPPPTPPGNGGIIITPETYVNGCKPLDPSAYQELGTLLTDGGNCQLAKIENYVTMATIGLVATVLTGGASDLLQVIYDAAVIAGQDLVEIALSGNAVLSNWITTQLETGFFTLANTGPALAVFSGTAVVEAGLLTTEQEFEVPASGTFALGTGTTLDNTSVITNDGTITDGNGSDAGAGTIDNAGTIINNGSIPNEGQGNGGLLITGHNYTLNFNLNGGLGTQPPNLDVFADTVSDSQQSLPTPQALPGEIFTGWYTQPTGGTQVTDGTDLSTLLLTGPSSMTLYAHYVLAQNEATATDGSGASAAYSGSAQNVSLSAQVISALGTVNEGTVTFSLLDGTSANDPTVGTATSAQVVNGAASVVYGLPAGLPAGSYSIDAVYSDPTGSLTGSGDGGKELTVATAPTTTTGVTTTDYTGSAQNVPLTAQVTSGVGTVNEGTVTFALQDGSEQSVTVSAPVSNGAASATLDIPAGLQNGSYTIIGSYSDPGGVYGSSSDVVAGGLPQTVVLPNPLRTFVAGQSWSLPLPFSDSIFNTFPWGDLDPASTGCTWNSATGTLSFVAIGTCILDATAPAEQGFAATPVSLSLPIGQGVDSMKFSPNPTTAVVGTAIPLSVTSASGATPSLSVDPGSVGNCTVTNGVVLLDAAGLCFIDATTPTTANYMGVTYHWDVEATLESPSIAFPSPPADLTVGDTSFEYATAASGTDGDFDIDWATPTYSIDPSSTGVCAVTGNAVTFTDAGSCQVDVSFPAYGDFAAATSSQTITVGGAALTPQTISFSTPPASPTVGATYAVSATATSESAVNLSIDPSSAAVCTLSAGVVDFNGPGSCEIDGSVDATGNYAAAASSQTVVVGTPSPSAPTVTAISPATGPTSGGTAITITGTGFLAGDQVVIGQGHGPATGTIAATSVTVVSPTEITATTGGGATGGTFSLYVVSPSGQTSAAAKADNFAYTAVSNPPASAARR